MERNSGCETIEITYRHCSKSRESSINTSIQQRLSSYIYHLLEIIELKVNTET